MKLLFLAAFLALSSLSPACHTPPTFWCDNPKISQECGVTAQCAQYKADTQNEPVNITLLYESLCPGCQQLILTYLYPVVYEQGGAAVNIELIPYGNARVMNGTIVCQHGPNECVLNMLESCAWHYISPSKRFDYLHCVESEVHRGATATVAREACFHSQKVSNVLQKKIMSCTTGPMGVKLQQAAAKRTAGIQPEKHQFVPWILINDRSTIGMQELQGDLMKLICKWYSGPHTPSVCRLLQEPAAAAEGQLSVCRADD